MPETTKPKEPPLVDVKVTNPVTYLRRWWEKVIGNEGVDFSFRIRPLTAIAIAFVVAAVGFGVGRFSLNIPFLKYEVLPTASPKAEETWKETAITGTLQFSEATGAFYLTTPSASEAITLLVPPNTDLTGLIGKRILATGSYNKKERIFRVFDAKDLEVLPKNPVPIPTLEPTATPSPTSEVSPSPEASPSSTPI